jgi:hypothetical protein
MILLAEFSQADTLVAAARQAQGEDLTVIDAFTPMPLPELDAFAPAGTSRLQVSMLISGAVMALVAFGVQTWSAVYDYPINSGGRPLFSWPAFLIAPVEVAILAAALVGFVVCLRLGGLPRLHHRLFDIPEFERASQDHFFLLVERPDEQGADEAAAIHRARQALGRFGALTVYEVGR